jgi:putative ABC transport system ATP-binding protein
MLDHLTVHQNLALVQQLAGGLDRDWLTFLLESAGLASRRRAYPSELSGGESARAGLAVALANKPRLVLADEPTGEVDSANEQRLLTLLRSLANQDVAILVVTHSAAVAAAVDRTIELFDGRVVQ